MTAINQQARETIKSRLPGETTIAGYARSVGWTYKWHGDSCGCPDDRCIGFHHDETDECGCLRVLLDKYACGLLGHQWSDEIREADYGRGPVRWRLCVNCTAADYLTVPADA